MLEIKVTSKFKKDLKQIIKRGYNISLLDKVVTDIASGVPLGAKYRDHILTGEYAGFHECHIEPDWLLVYKLGKDELILYLLRTGTNSDLF